MYNLFHLFFVRTILDFPTKCLCSKVRIMFLTAFYCTREASHIDLSTRNVIWTLVGGGGGLAPVTFLSENYGKFQ